MIKSSSKQHVNALQLERSSSTLSCQPFTNLIYDTSFYLKLQNLYRLITSNSTLSRHFHECWWINNKQRYMQACHLAEEFVRLIKENQLMKDEESLAAIQLMAGEDFFVLLHLTMFLPALETLASEEQKKKWYEPGKDFRILGTYAQTELGHGSYVQGLETTAVLDLETDEWVLNTPTLTSTKWWPGGLAKSCTHCILMARMQIKDRDYGIHPFLLQVRDLNTHESLKGVFLMHIGQKLGYNAMDNGGMQLMNVRIPRTNLLMRFYHVDKFGNYKAMGNKKLLYGTMTFTRKQIIWGAGIHLAKSVVVAIRYSAARHQFPNTIKTDSKDNDRFERPEEAQVLDYSTQQFMLFPLLSSAIAFTICGRWVHEVYQQFMNEAKTGNFQRLDEVHCLTSSLKAAMTMIVIDGLETARKSCGGHGYLLAAGIPLNLSNYLPQATYEGDFVVMSIQAGRSLIKVVEKKMKNKPLANASTSSMKYVYDFEPFEKFSTIPTKENSIAALKDPVWLLKAFQRRSSVLIYKAANSFSVQLSKHKDMLKALDFVKIEFTRIVKAHAHVLILEQYQKRLDIFYRKNTGTYNIVGKALHDLYATYWMYESFGEFVAAGALAAHHYDILLSCIKELLLLLRPHAIILADAFSFPDYLLNSALGRYDGDVYAALFNSAKNEPLNDRDVSDGYYQHIQYILHPERKNPNKAKL